MTLKINLHNNVIVKKGDEIAAICRPLTDIYNVTYFRYLRLFNDGSRFILCNQPDVMRFFYEDGYYPLAWHDQAKPTFMHRSGFIIWALKRLSDSDDQKKIASEMQQLFDIKQGVAYVQKHINFVEIFDFGSPEIFIYDIDQILLKQFIFYFKEQTKKLIESVPDEKIIIPITKNELEINDTKDKEDKFLELIKTQKYHLSGTLEGSYLTNREVACLNWYFRGKTAEETALLLGISKKTVERHIDNIKQKLNCYKQSQLIYKAAKLGLIISDTKDF